MKRVLLSLTLLLSTVSFAQQNNAERAKLKEEKVKLNDQIKKIKTQIVEIDKEMGELPGWTYGAMTTVGATFSEYNNWYLNSLRNSESGNIGVVVNGFLNYNKDKYFFKNSGLLNLAWTKVVDLDKKNIIDEDKDYKNTSDVLNLSSLFGYKLNQYIATSVLGEYRTTIVESFNNPGYLDLGVGVTVTPIKKLMVVLHPLNYNFVFSDGETEYNSSLGCKAMAEYKNDFGFLKFRSNLSAFLSYSNPEDYSNWTWTNSLKFKVWKTLGIGVESGLRQNKQEAFNSTGGAAKWGKLENSSNDLQSYWLLGLSYSF